MQQRLFFYEKGLNLLREQGVLNYISSNKWFRAAYGKKLRQLITRETQLQQIIDFGDAPVFAAIAYPTIVIIQKGKPQKQLFQALNWEMGQSISQFETVVQSQSFKLEPRWVSMCRIGFTTELKQASMKRLWSIAPPATG